MGAFRTNPNKGAMRGKQKMSLSVNKIARIESSASCHSLVAMTMAGQDKTGQERHN